MKIRILLESVCNLKERLFVERSSQNLETYREIVFCKTARYRDTRYPREVCRDSEYIREIHAQRIVDLLSDLEGSRRRSRRDDAIEFFKHVIKILFQLSPHF